MKRFIVIFLIVCAAVSGCQKKTDGEITEKKKDQAENIVVNTKGDQKQTNEVEPPSKEEVLAMREIVQEGMKKEDIKRMREAVTAANLALEHGFFYQNLEERLADPGDAVWNYLHETGEIVEGYAFDEDVWDKKEEEGLTEREYEQKYGDKVYNTNQYDADRILRVLAEIKSTIRNEDLVCDFGRIIADVKEAKESHDAKCIMEIYRILHDMDYYLLRYGQEDVSAGVKDLSTLKLYYGELTCYKK